MPAATHVMNPHCVPIDLEPDESAAAQLREAGRDLGRGSVRLWRRLVESRAWPTVLDLAASERQAPGEVAASTVGAILGSARPQSFCARLDVAGLRLKGLPPELLRSAEQALAWTAPWALVLEVANLSPVFVAGLAARLPTFLLDPRTDRLVRLPGGNGRLVESFLVASWLETEACVVANPATTHDLLEAP